MDRQLNYGNRIINQREYERRNHLLLTKLMNLKYANFSHLNSSHKPKDYLERDHPQDNKLRHSPEIKNRRVKIVLKQKRIQQQNRQFYERLVNQRPTISNKLLAQQRTKNVEFLKRIRRYPYSRVNSMMLQPLESESDNNKFSIKSLEKPGESYSKQPHSMHRLKSSLNINVNAGEHIIILYSKMIQLNKKKAYSVSFHRHKCHYQIQLSSSKSNSKYLLKLPEHEGTMMLSQNDYDYEKIAHSFIKFSHNYICMAFTLLQTDKKKYFYRFQKITTQEEPSSNTNSNVQEEKYLSRKTMFALQNEDKEKQQTKNQQAKNKQKRTFSNRSAQLESIVEINCNMAEQP